MKIDLHSNLPAMVYNPNAALGYIKSYLSQEKDFIVRNNYWNLLPPNLQDKYSTLYSELPSSLRDNMHPIIARYLFDGSTVKDSSTELSTLFQPPFFLTYNIKDVAEELKTYINNRIQDKKLDNVDVAGFTMTMNQWFFNYYVIRQLKTSNPQMKIVIGGIQSASQGVEFLHAFEEVDFAIWGEGEIPFTQLLKHLDDSTMYKDIPNLIFREGDDIVTNRQIEHHELLDINMFPFADHSDFFDLLQEYGLEQNVTIPIWGSRSCWWNQCKFCVHNKGFFYRHRTPENVVEEIEHQSKKHHIDSFMFADNEIGRQKKEDFYHLLDLLLVSADCRKKPYNIVRTALTPLRVDRRAVEAMKKIAVTNVLLGFEAVTDSLLHKMMKIQSYAHNIQSLKLIDEKDYYPKVGFNIIRGIPSETPEDVIESMNNLKFLRFYLKKFTPNLVDMMFYKDSSFYEQVSEEEREKSYTVNMIWSEISKLDFLSSVDKREFSNFDKDLSNYLLWVTFQELFYIYASENFNYLWYGYSDGSSVIEEYGRNKNELRCAYTFNPLETQLLVFCDTVKTYSEIKEQFNTFAEEDIQKILRELKLLGLLYFNDDFKYYFLSVVSAKKISFVINKNK
jgi:radical SAM superfamily enzyme YgiQ (UPF0313 family)